MVIVKVISATGRLKNKIDFSYSVETTVGETIVDSGMIYSVDPNDIINGEILAVSFSGSGTFSRTFEDIPNGRYYAVAYAYDDGIGNNYYSSAVEFAVSDNGYELSLDNITIANPLVISNGSEGNDKVLMSDSSGLTRWIPVRSLFSLGHYIGELYGGGIVVDVWKEGDDEKILIASLEDLKNTNGFFDTNGSIESQWIYGGSMNTTLIGSSAQSLYDGKSNTNSIINNSNISGASGSAAQVCIDYRGGGYDDWYLPAYYEINNLYNQAGAVNKVLDVESINANTRYWTSTEASIDRSHLISSGGYLISEYKSRNYFDESMPRIRAVRKESTLAGGGLCLNLDVTNSKSFDDSTYISLGTSSKWTDLVNGGMTSSYSFNLSAYPSVSSGGSSVNIIPALSNITGPGTTFSGYSGSWYLSNITNSDPSMPKLYNNGGTSSFVSNYFSVGYKDAALKFRTRDVSSSSNMKGATLNIYISTQSGGYSSSYKLIGQVTNTTSSANDVNIPLYSYNEKTISIKITAPYASYTSVSSYVGTSLDEIYVVGTNGGYQATGPVYFPDESGFLRFNGTGSNVDAYNTFGSYVDFKAPLGSASTVTVEMWARIKSTSKFIFGWDKYDVITNADGVFGFNTGQGDIYGITSSRIQEFINVWKHYVFEMRSDVSYTNNKIYINGEQQEIAAQIAPYSGGTLGVENPSRRNFNGGVGRIGCWGNIPTNLFDGDISVFRVYNRALSKDEVMKNYSEEKKRYEILPTVMKANLKMGFDANYSYSGTGTTITVVGSHSNGSIVTSDGYVSPTYSNSTTLYPGKYFTFNGSNTKIEYSPINLVENMSWEAWVRCTGTVSSPNPSFGGASINMFMGQVLPYFAMRDYGFVFSNYINNTQTYLVSPYDTFLDKWNHVVFTTETVSNKTLSKIYVNGSKSAETYDNGTQSKWLGSNYNFALGDGQGTDRPTSGMTKWFPFKGDLAQVRVYYKTLSYEEVKNNYDTSKHIYEYDYDNSSKFYTYAMGEGPTFSISQNLVLDIPGKDKDKILRSDSNGKATWVDKNYLFNRPINQRFIGDFYGGGIIVSAWKYPSNAFNYLIMSLEDISASVWSNVSSGLANATSEHNGISNTTAIKAQSGHTTSAAKLCDDYVGGGFTDWYLPSITELSHGFNTSQIVGSVLGKDNLTESYWTSTEIDSTKAYSYSFTSNANKKTSINMSPKDGSVSLSSILTNGLILNLDAGNVASYAGTGTSWTDLSGNGNIATLNGASYSSENEGVLVFDGIDDAVYINSGSGLNIGSTYTFSIWIKFNGFNTVVGGSSAFYDSGYPMYVADSNTMYIAAGMEYVGISGANLATNQWVCLTVSRSGSSVIWYKNGVSIGSGSLVTTAANVVKSIGAYYGGGFPLNGKISSVQIYNRELSASEVLHNFDATKYRFGFGSSFKIRPFRQVKVYDIIHSWQSEWSVDYTPIWNAPYKWTEENWSYPTSIVIDVNPIVLEYKSILFNDNITTLGYISMTFSNTVTTNETIINTGVCWATASANPTIANSLTYSTSPGSFATKTTNIYAWFGPVPVEPSLWAPEPFYFRAFVTTSSGTYYSTNSNYSSGGLSTTSYTKYFGTIKTYY